MTWIDATSIVFALVTMLIVLRASIDIKHLLTDARYERLEINRRLEKMSRRLDRLDGGTDTNEGGLPAD